LYGQRKRFSGAAAVETEINKIQTEKMDKIVVEVLDGEKNRFSTITSGAPVETGKEALDSMQTEKINPDFLRTLWRPDLISDVRSALREMLHVDRGPTFCLYTDQ
jgi:hypothetical protein